MRPRKWHLLAVIIALFTNVLVRLHVRAIHATHTKSRSSREDLCERPEHTTSLSMVIPGSASLARVSSCLLGYYVAYLPDARMTRFRGRYRVGYMSENASVR